MEYDYCPFCGEKKWGYRKYGHFGNKVIEWFICVDCDRVEADYADVCKVSEEPIEWLKSMIHGENNKERRNGNDIDCR